MEKIEQSSGVEWSAVPDKRSDCPRFIVYHHHHHHLHFHHYHHHHPQPDANANEAKATASAETSIHLSQSSDQSSATRSLFSQAYIEQLTEERITADFSAQYDGIIGDSPSPSLNEVVEQRQVSLPNLHTSTPPGFAPHISEKRDASLWSSSAGIVTTSKSSQRRGQSITSSLCSSEAIFSSERALERDQQSEEGSIELQMNIEERSELSGGPHSPPFLMHSRSLGSGITSYPRCSAYSSIPRALPRCSVGSDSPESPDSSHAEDSEVESNQLSRTRIASAWSLPDRAYFGVEIPPQQGQRAQRAACPRPQPLPLRAARQTQPGLGSCVNSADHSPIPSQFAGGIHMPDLYGNREIISRFPLPIDVRTNMAGSPNQKNVTSPRQVKLSNEINIELIEQGLETRRSVMIRNIPNKYTRKMLLSALRKHFSGEFDYFYLPMDPRNNCNTGYAFVNFLRAEPLVQFVKDFHGKKWEKFNSEKICEVCFADIQGVEELAAHHSGSAAARQSSDKQPLFLRGNEDITHEVISGQRAPHPLQPLYQTDSLGGGAMSTPGRLWKSYSRERSILSSGLRQAVDAQGVSSSRPAVSPFMSSAGRLFTSMTGPPTPEARASGDTSSADGSGLSPNNAAQASLEATATMVATSVVV